MNAKFTRVILGSKSPRRRELLQHIIPHFEVIDPEADEVYPPGMGGEEIAVHLAGIKARGLKKMTTNETLVITADTIVWLNDHILGKPRNEADAIRMLRIISGQKHEVFTGVCLMTFRKIISFSVRSEVKVNRLSDLFIRNYVQDKRPFDKAGAYGVQELFPVKIKFVKKHPNEIIEPINSPPDPPVLHITGSYSNVMGLPLTELYRNLGLI